MAVDQVWRGEVGLHLTPQSVAVVVALLLFVWLMMVVKLMAEHLMAVVGLSMAAVVVLHHASQMQQGGLQALPPSSLAEFAGVKRRFWPAKISQHHTRRMIV